MTTKGLNDLDWLARLEERRAAPGYHDDNNYTERLHDLMTEARIQLNAARAENATLQRALSDLTAERVDLTLRLQAATKAISLKNEVLKYLATGNGAGGCMLCNSKHDPTEHNGSDCEIAIGLRAHP